MQMRPWTYLRSTPLWRSLLRLMRQLDAGASTEISPLLIYITVALILALAVLEIDAHQVALKSLGLLANDDYPVPATLLGP